MRAARSLAGLTMSSPALPVVEEADPGFERSISVATASAALDTDHSTIRKMLRAGEVSGHRIGTGKIRGGVRIYAWSIRAYQERNAIGGSPEPRSAPTRPRRRSLQQTEAAAYLRKVGVLPQDRG